MSNIISAGNLSVSQSLSVGGNTILGTNSTNLLTCNAIPTLNNGLNVVGNVVQQSTGSISSGTGGIISNGDLLITSNKKITSGTGQCTFNGPTSFNQNVTFNGITNTNSGTNLGAISCTSINNSGSYNTISCTSLSDSGNLNVSGTSNLGALNTSLLNNSGNLSVSGISTLGVLNTSSLNTSSLNNSGNLSVSGTSTLGALNISSLNNSGSYNAISCTSVNNSGSYNAVSCTSLTDSGDLTVSGTSSLGTLNTLSINNTGTLSTSNIELTSPSIAYIDMKTVGNNNDYDVRISSSGGSSSTAGVGTLTITSGNTIINSPLSAYSGTFSGITNNTNTLTNNGQLTQVGLANFSNLIKLSSGQSVYITDAGITNYLRMHHSGTTSVIDFTGNLSFRNNGSNNNLLINSSTNQATFGYNLNTTGIINSTNAFTNNAVLNQNNSSNFSTTIAAPSIKSNSTFFAGSSNNFDESAISNPKVYNGIASGTADGASYTQFNLAINSWNGVGFVYSNSGAPSVCKLVINNRTGDLSTQGSITCDSINVNNNGELNSLYRNNIKNYNIRGYSSKASGTNTFSWLLSSTQQTYTTNIALLPIDTTCFSIQILYTYYSTGTSLYQGATPYYIIKYGSGDWITNGGSAGNTQGAFQYQPTISVSGNNTTLYIYHTTVLNNNDYVYFTYKVEMY